jgi:FAD:protein FMN transferase
MKTVTFRAMGTDVQITILPSDSDDNLATEEAIKQAQARISELEARLSRFQSDSEITKINNHPSRWIEVHKETIEVLRLATEAFVRTNRIYNPCLGGIMEQIGYAKTFEKINSHSDAVPLVHHVPFVLPTHCPFELDIQHAKVQLAPGCKIDLGGIAKGWIVEQAATEIGKFGFTNFICNAGGDMVCRGKNGNVPWCIAIANPFVPEKGLFNLDVTNSAVATSGTYRRKWSINGLPFHHIIDPFLGRPVETDVVSCTVIDNRLVDAEIMAKVGLILGTKLGVEWLKQQKTDGWVIIKRTGEVIHAWNS